MSNKAKWLAQQRNVHIKVLPKHTKQITKCHALHVYVVVENVENLEDAWCMCVCVCVCVCMCVCVCVCVPRYAVGSLPGLFGRFGRVSVR